MKSDLSIRVFVSFDLWFVGFIFVCVVFSLVFVFVFLLLDCLLLFVCMINLGWVFWVLFLLFFFEGMRFWGGRKEDDNFKFCKGRVGVEVMR